MGKTKIRRPPDTNGFFYRNELWYHPAYQGLTSSARNLLHSLINELKWGWFKKKKIYTNNGKISFTENQFIELYKSSSDTYNRSRNQLIINGIIKVTYRGGYGKGDRSEYKLLMIDGVLHNEQRWKTYPQNSWGHEIPRSTSRIGIKTRFQKGVSGKKSFSTLKDKGQKSENNPDKSDTRK